MGHLSGAAA